MEDIPRDKYIISVDLVEHGNALAITHDDSSIMFYDTRTMTILNGLDDTNTVTCLAQAGFQFPLENPGMLEKTNSTSSRHSIILGLSTAFSSNGCAAVLLNAEGQMQLRLMEHSFGSTGDLYDESKIPDASRSFPFIDAFRQIRGRNCCFDTGV